MISPSPMPLAGKRVTVMGLGRFGGGIGAVRFLAASGCRVTVTDLLPPEKLAESLAALAGVPFTLHLGAHPEEDFRDCDLVVASPAVPRENRYLQLARQAGVPITSEMNLFWERNPARTVCVTGTNGKSTTTALVHSLLSASGRRCRLGGNIGRSLLPEIHQIQADEWIVLELSSFQLEDLAALKPRPDVAIVTNFAPNHLDRHGSLQAYRAAKQLLLAFQGPDQLAILNQDDGDVRHWPTRARTLWFGLRDEGRDGLFALRSAQGSHALFRDGTHEQIFPLREWLALPGAHNLQNALAAACAALAMGGSPALLEQTLRGFQSLPHRLETVGEVEGRLFVNDSKATTPEAAALALRAFERPVVLLAGGYDKGVDLSPLVDAAVATPVKAAALIGATAGRLQAGLGGRVPCQVFTVFEDAIRWAFHHSAPGDVVLLSPGCASYDMFQDYEERGREFARLARQLRSAGGAQTI